MGMQLQAPQPVRCLPLVRHLASVVEQVGQAPQVERSARPALVLVAAALSTITVSLRLVAQVVLLPPMLEVQEVQPRQLLRDSAGMELLGCSRAASTTARRRRCSTAGPAVVVVARPLPAQRAAVAVAEGAVSGLPPGTSSTMVVSPLTVGMAATRLVSLLQAVVAEEQAASSALELCPQPLERFRPSVVSVVRPQAQAQLVSTGPRARSMWWCSHDTEVAHLRG